MFPAGAYDADTVKQDRDGRPTACRCVKIERRRDTGRAGSRPTPRDARRTTAGSPRTTPFPVDGPAAGDARLRTTRRPERPHGARHAATTAPAARPRGARCSPARRTSTSTSRSPARSTRATPSPTPATASPAPAPAAGATVDPRFDLTAGAARAVPLRLGRRGRPVRPDSRRRASTRCSAGFKHEGANIHIAADGHAVAYMGDDERGDYLYKFVSAGTVRPARHPGRPPPQPGAARPGHAVRRPARPATAPTDGEYDGTGQWIPLTSDTESYVAGMTRRRRAHRHPARRRQGRADPDGPARGRRAEPGQRQGLRRADQQLQPRHDVPGRRGEPGRGPARSAPRSARR